MHLAAILIISGLPSQCAGATAETWHLNQGQDWKSLSSNSPNDKYLLEVARIKQLIENGQTEDVQQALNQLKEDFPKIAGPDLDAFIQAEILFANGKLVKASRSYDKFLDKYYHDSGLYKAALVRQFHIGTTFLAGRKRKVLKLFKIRGYATGAKIMERITERAPDEPIGIKAAVSIAQSYEKRKKFEDAYEKWAQILAQWPDDKIAKDALLATARCRHANYRGPNYDASDLAGRPFSVQTYYDSAKASYEDFNSKYPQDATRIGVEQMIQTIDQQMAYKDLKTARYYQKTGSIEAANHYYRMVASQWPGTEAAKMAQDSLNKNASKTEKVMK